MGDDTRAFVRKIAKAGFGDKPKIQFYVEWANKHTRHKHVIRYRGHVVLRVHLTPSDNRSLANMVASLRQGIAAVDKKLDGEKVDLTK